MLVLIFALVTIAGDRYDTFGMWALPVILLLGVSWVLVPFFKRAPGARSTYLGAELRAAMTREQVADITERERSLLKSRLIRIRDATAGTSLEGVAITCVDGALNALKRGAPYQVVDAVLLEPVGK